MSRHSHPPEHGSDKGRIAKATPLRTREQVKEDLRAQGLSVASWAIANGFSVPLAQQVLAGRLKGVIGEARLIATALGLVDPTPKLPASQVYPVSPEVRAELAALRQRRAA